jgi:hypothetical protein
VPVFGPSAPYKVEQRGGRYCVIADGAPTAIPTAYTDAIPDTPEKAAKIRDLLTIVQVHEIRPATSDEWAARQPQYEDSPSLYAQSVFMRNEYAILPEGGAHGPFTIGDLLRRPGSSGGYIVPDGPAVLAGIHFHGVCGNTLQLCGLIAFDRASASYNVYLHGHESILLQWQRFALACEGQFTVRSDPLWAAPGGAPELNFTGFVEFRDSGRPVFRGSATGRFVPTPRKSTSTSAPKA